MKGMSAEALGALKRAKRVFLRTERHPVVPSLRLTGIPFETMDDLADSHTDPDSFSAALTERLFQVASESSPVAYAVPGHPLVEDETVRFVTERAREKGIPTRLVSSRSFLEPVLEAVGYGLQDGLQCIAADALYRIAPNPRLPQIYYRLETPELAAALKSVLLRVYPADFHVSLVYVPGTEESEILEIPLAEIDQQEYDALTSLFVPPLPRSRMPGGFAGLLEIVAALRGPNGCPWDKEQTHQSLKTYLLEETYEVLEAIDGGDPIKLCEELGDLLLQVVMHAQFASEADHFDIERVIAMISDKLIRRHPHVFGDVEVVDADEVLRNWDALKVKEKAGDARRSSILDGIPKTLPALQRALDVSKRAARAGFEWDTIEGVLEKLEEEEIELRTALASNDQERIEAEIGDLLFTAVNVARHARINPEDALRRMVDRFVLRFRYMEQEALEAGSTLESLTPDQWEELWQQAKAKEAG
jgi:tetrapyrrole methylase family protein/MazG family protein